MGTAVGKWIDDYTFETVTVGLNDKTWLAGVGTVHSEKLRVTERYTRDTHDTIRYEATMVDPEVLTKPWIPAPLRRPRPRDAHGPAPDAPAAAPARR